MSGLGQEISGISIWTRKKGYQTEVKKGVVSGFCQEWVNKRLVSTKE